MSEQRKRNIVIASLCGVLLLMVVGYAAFSTLLNIEGTTSISSNWNVLITNIEEKNKIGKASTIEGYPTHDTLTATFQTNLVSPGDSIEYDITVENQGNLNAELARIKVSQNDNEAIKFTTSGLEEGNVLEASGKAILTIKVEYSDGVTSQPDNLTANLTVTLDYVQQGHKSEWTPNYGTALEKLIKTVVTEGDGLYSDTYEAGRYVYKGAKPNNYITFNGENAGWRIVSVETDGTIKIMRNTSIGQKVFDAIGKRKTGFCSYGNAPSWSCNVWSKIKTFSSGTFEGEVSEDSDINIYLIDIYYNKINTNKSAIENHSFYFGSAIWNNNNLTTQINTEKQYYSVNSIGLIQLSDYIKANTNTDKCNSFSLINSNVESCKTTNYMSNLIFNNYYWTITPYGSETLHRYCSSVAYYISYDGSINGNLATGEPEFEIFPTIYLKSDTELEGQGTESQPYTITNYA